MKLLGTLIQSNIFISLAAVSLTIETQIQLGMEPQWHPYLFLIFFATLFEYNIHRLITIFTNKQALSSEKHQWVRENLIGFYILVSFSVLGFLIAAVMAKTDVLIALAPIALITLFYSVPVYKDKRSTFRLREIPYLKIFLIGFVWSAITILLPVIQSPQQFSLQHILAMLIERFLFVFAITIPFDIRDLEADRQAGLKTLPGLFHEHRAMRISYLAIILFGAISIIHYAALHQWMVCIPLLISALTTYFFLSNQKMKKLEYYHYGLLDGTMLLQGVLVILFNIV